MKIWITGSGGLVGRNILEAPEAREHEWFAPTRKELDLFDAQAVMDFALEHRPDLVIHCAGRVGGIQANMSHPVEFLVENVDIGRNVIMAAKSAGVKKLLNLGSSCIYPRNAPNPLTESMILLGELEPTNEGYAIAKIFALRLCQYINRKNEGLKYKTIIPCNLYGRHDKFDPQSSHLIPAIIRKIHYAKVNNLPTVDIWGDGKARREFFLASDLASNIFQCIEKFDDLPDVMNVGVGQDHSVEEYYRVTCDVVGYHGKFVFDLSKPTGMKQKLMDVTQSKQLGIFPKTDLRTGIQQTYEYFIKLESK